MVFVPAVVAVSVHVEVVAPVVVLWPATAFVNVHVEEVAPVLVAYPATALLNVQVDEVAPKCSVAPAGRSGRKCRVEGAAIGVYGCVITVSLAMNVFSGANVWLTDHPR